MTAHRMEIGKMLLAFKAASPGKGVSEKYFPLMSLCTHTYGGVVASNRTTPFPRSLLMLCPFGIH